MVIFTVQQPNKKPIQLIYKGNKTGLNLVILLLEMKKGEQSWVH